MRKLILTACALAVAGSAEAQETLLPSSSWGTSPVFTTWHFSSGITENGLSVTDVRQLAVPLRFRTVLGDRWTFDVSGAATGSSVSAKSGDTVRTLSLNGLTDLRMRVSGAVIGDGVVATAGVNVPTGATRLNGDQATVLQTIGAPALRMPISSLGMGPGATVGLIAAQEAGSWALAAGASLEARSEYTPIDLTLASGSSPTKIAPGKALHLTLGGDRALPSGHFAVLLVGDAYTSDQITTGATPSTSNYKLGPQATGVMRLDVAPDGWREVGTNVAVRYRSQYTDGTGAQVAGSSATYVDASMSGIKGGARGVGVILGMDARFQTGFTAADGLVGAGVGAGGLTLGLEFPGTKTVFRIAARGQAGALKLPNADGVTMGTGFSIVAAIGARGEAR